MPANHVLLEKIVVGAGGASAITFSNIPQTGYTDLKLVVSFRTNAASESWGGAALTFNGSTSGYVSRNLRLLGGTGVDAGSGGSSSFSVIYNNGNSATANMFGAGQIYIPSYTSANNKSVSMDLFNEDNQVTVYSCLWSGVWANSAAINTFTLTPILGSATLFNEYSSFYLYGISKPDLNPVLAPSAYGGDTIMTDGNYWYHAFKYSGSFAPIKGLSCDVLVVAGGGSGGGGQGGGGGAGGVLAFASQTVSTTQTVTVGLGGVGVARDSVGNTGGNSQFGSLTAALGGGGGGCYGAATAAGTTGGSGGGAGSKNTGNPIAGASGTAGQGNAGGGVTSYTAPYNGGGGGGAGGVGGAGSGSSTGNGGAGVNSVTNWGSLSTALTTLGLGVSGFIAGGGAGAGDTTSPGTGGSGGGGTGGSGAGTPNTGSGGQGSVYAGGSGTSGVGGSGLVIVRYAV
jgi:hypothetical protein